MEADLKDNGIVDVGNVNVNGIVDVGNVNVNKENMKEFLWHSYISGKSLTVTHQVFVLKQKFNALIEAVSKFDLSEEERIILNEFRL